MGLALVSGACADALLHGEGLPAVCGALASTGALAYLVVRQTRLARTANDANHRQELPSSSPSEQPAQQRQSVQAAPEASRDSVTHSRERETDAHVGATEELPQPPAAHSFISNATGPGTNEPEEAPATVMPNLLIDNRSPVPSSEAESTEAPVSPTALQATQPHSVLDFPALSERLIAADDPIPELKAFVTDIRTRMHEADAASAPCPLEQYAARMLEEADLFATDIELPDISAVRPYTSHMVYLRCLEPKIAHLALQRIIRIEAALNAIRFACASLPDDASQEDAYLLNQHLARSIVSQAAPINEPPELPHNTQPDGEWAVRYGISRAIETLQVPYRLTARYRTNVADGNVAIEFDFTPAELFPSSWMVEGVGIVPSTGDMRQRAAADYALRIAILLAASAFGCSKRIRHVWVAATFANAKRRTCYLSVDFDRWRFGRVDLQELGDLSELYRQFAAVMRYEDGWLRPVRQGFHLEEERFCPSRRYVPVSLSSRRLEGRVAEQLGCDHVSALAIEEADGRSLVASAIMLRLAAQDDQDATQKNVRTIMELAGDDPDPSVRSAAERVVRRLIDGTLASDAWTVGEEFVRGDALTRANDRAKELLMGQKPADALAALLPLLAQLDGSGLYDDSSSIVYRYFGSYAERALYNRLCADADSYRTVMLVPDAYYEAHLLASLSKLMLGRAEEALAHAQRMCTLAPLDARSRLQAVSCLEQLGRDDDAIEQLIQLLELAHEPMGVGLAYYRLASFEWRTGHPLAAQACYERAMHVLPGSLPVIAMELSMLYIQHGAELTANMTQEQADDVLVAHGIPLAPTERTSAAFYECAQASLDAEIFPVARTFAHILGAFAGDDIIAGMVRSLEDAPDH